MSRKAVLDKLSKHQRTALENPVRAGEEVPYKDARKHFWREGQLSIGLTVKRASEVSPDWPVWSVGVLRRNGRGEIIEPQDWKNGQYNAAYHAARQAVAGVGNRHVERIARLETSLFLDRALTQEEALLLPEDYLAETLEAGVENDVES